LQIVLAPEALAELAGGFWVVQIGLAGNYAVGWHGLGSFLGLLDVLLQ
jgi:hypothetical protein